MINRVVLVGRLTRDPEIRYTPAGVAMATLGIAVDKGIAKEKQREGEPTAYFFNLVAWRNQAEFASTYLTKGRLVGVDGYLQQRSYVDKEGQKRTSIEVVADRLQSLERAPDSEGGPSGGPRPAGGANAGASGSRSSAPADDFSDNYGQDDFNDPFADN